MNSFSMAYFDWMGWVNWKAMGQIGQIIMIDVLLSGDNAMLIALACRDLPASQRTQGVLWGAIGAILLRIILATFAVMLLTLPLLRILGGLLLLGISVKLIWLKRTRQNGQFSQSSNHVQSSDRLIAAIKTIIVADLAMSIDNVIGIAGAAQAAGTQNAQYRLFLITLGLFISFPLIIWGSRLMLKLLDRFPLIITAGAALLGWIAGRLIISDPFAQQLSVFKAPVASAIAGLIGALSVVVIGSISIKINRKPH